MSKDKHKKRDRAFAFIRGLRAGYRGFPRGEAKATLSGPMPAVVRYCVERGLATLTRSKPGTLYGRAQRARHNFFNADLES